MTIDTVVPAISADSLTTDHPAPALTGTTNDPAASIAVTVNGISHTAVNNGDGTWSLPAGTITPALLAGLYGVVAVATDLAGNAATSTGGGELRIRPPVATIDSLPLRSQGLSRLIAWAAVPGAEEYLVQCSTTNTFDAVVTSGWSSDTAFTFLNLADGLTYYYRVQSRTEIGDDLESALDSEMLLSDWSPTVFSTQDATAPGIAFTDLLTSDPTPPLFGTIDDPSAAIKLRINGTDYVPLNNGDGTWTLADGIISPALGNGSHVVTITATDAAGNVTVLDGNIRIEPPLPDANGDGKVDAFDLNQLAGNWQTATSGGTSEGDFNNDGIVDAFDLNALAAQWQAPTPTEPPPTLTFAALAEPVPNPANEPAETNPIRPAPEVPLTPAVEPAIASPTTFLAPVTSSTTAPSITVTPAAAVAPVAVPVLPSIHGNAGSATPRPAPAISITNAKRPADAPDTRKSLTPPYVTRLPALVKKVRRLLLGDDTR